MVQGAVAADLPLELEGNHLVDLRLAYTGILRAEGCDRGLHRNIQSRYRFVCNNNPCTASKGARDPDPLFLAAR